MLMLSVKVTVESENNTQTYRIFAHDQFEW